MRLSQLQQIVRGYCPQLGIREDSAEAALFLRDLTYIYTQPSNILYGDLKARQIMPLDTQVPPGAEVFVWRQFDKFGTVKFGDMSAEDMPTAEVVGREFEQRVLSATMSYQYSVQEMRAAAMAGVPLDTMKQQAVRRAFEQATEATAVLGAAGAQLLDRASRVALQGSAGINAGDVIPMYGFANAPDIINAAVADVASGYAGVNAQSGSTLQTALNWTLASTPIAAIVDDFNAMRRAMFNITLGRHNPNLFLVPTAIWSRISTQARSSTFTSDTLMSYMQDLAPGVEFMHWPALDLAGLKQDNSTAGPRMMLCEKSPENFQLVIPQEFEQMPPQLVNFVFRIPCHQRFGGVRMPYPKSVCFLDGAAG